MRLFEGTTWDRPPRCEVCGELDEECLCPPSLTPRHDPAQQTVRISEEKRAKGKFVTMIRGISATKEELLEVLAQLKSACGAGGTLKDDELEIQGSHRDRLSEILKSLGYRVKK